MEITQTIRERIENMVRRTRSFQRFFLDDKNQFRTEAKPFMKWLHFFCHVERPTYKVSSDGKIDTHAMAVAEGRREVYLQLMQLINGNEEKLNRQLQQLKDEDI